MAPGVRRVKGARDTTGHDRKVGGQQVRCVCCRTLGEKHFCDGCRKMPLCPDCGHCMRHCTCLRRPLCPTCGTQQ
jgi:hypothetical protein